MITRHDLNRSDAVEVEATLQSPEQGCVVGPAVRQADEPAVTALSFNRRAVLRECLGDAPGVDLIRRLNTEAAFHRHIVCGVQVAVNRRRWEPVFDWERSGKSGRRMSTSGERPRLVFFHSRTSGPSRRTEGYLAQILQRSRNHGTFRLVDVDVDEHPELAERFRVQELPTLIVVEEKQERTRIVKPRSGRAIEQLLAPWLVGSSRRSPDSP